MLEIKAVKDGRYTNYEIWDGDKFIIRCFSLREAKKAVKTRTLPNASYLKAECQNF